MKNVGGAFLLNKYLQQGGACMSDNLATIGKTARSALANIGVNTLEDLREYDLGNLQKIHGIGPKAIRILEAVLKEVGWSFKEEEILPFKTDFGVFGDLNCNNAPKRETIRNFHIATYIQDVKYLSRILSPDLVVELMAGERLVSINEFIAFMGENFSKPSSLHMNTLITHGKEGASEVMIVNKQAGKLHFAYFFEFASHKKDSLIHKIKIYVN